ncbi:hypothetical protein KAR91_85850 [Candidatus Pacearchaeota archaeon]|nr:hypothetical protein [Candidatus Pacearchaeota archaeon]
MWVKVGTKWYSNEEQNIMVVLSQEERDQINTQPPGDAKLADLVVSLTVGEMSEFMEQDMSKGWSNAAPAEPVKEWGQCQV